MFFYLCKVLFSGFLQFNGNFVDAQNNSEYRDWAPLNALNMLRLTLLRYVALACCDRLAGALLSFSFSEPTILPACGRNRDLWEHPFQGAPKMKTAWNRMGRIRLFPLLFPNGCSQNSRFLPQARRIVGSGDENVLLSTFSRIPLMKKL